MWEWVMPQLVYLARIIGAALCGFAIGFERKLRLKEAGIRTHAIVAMGASLIMIVSKYGFSDIVNYDASRVAAQIVSGIGFLGAGMIIYKREALRGLTTAAGIWTTAGIGMCIGSGLYLVAVVSTFVIILVQLLLHTRIKIFRSPESQLVNVNFVLTEGAIEKVKKIFCVDRFLKLRTVQDAKGVTCSVILRSKHILSDEDLAQIVVDNGFISIIEKVPEEF